MSEEIIPTGNNQLTEWVHLSDSDIINLMDSWGSFSVVRRFGGGESTVIMLRGMAVVEAGSIRECMNKISGMTMDQIVSYAQRKQFTGLPMTGNRINRTRIPKLQ